MANVLLERHLKPGPTFAIPEIVRHNWVQKFHQRHLEVKAVKIRIMNALRVHGANIGQLIDWFEIAKEDLLVVTLYNIYNIDKT